MTFVLGLFCGIIFGSLITQWVVVEFIKDQVSKEKMYYADKHGKWHPKNPIK